MLNLSDISATAQQAPPAPTVTVASVETRATHLWDEFSGRLEAVNRVEVRPRVTGAILSANFTEGELVRTGDVLFIIDPAPYEAEVARADAQRQSEQGNAATALPHGSRPFAVDANGTTTIEARADGVIAALIGSDGWASTHARRSPRSYEPLPLP